MPNMGINLGLLYCNKPAPGPADLYIQFNLCLCSHAGIDNDTFCCFKTDGRLMFWSFNTGGFVQ